MRQTLNSGDFDYEQVSKRLGDIILQQENPTVTLTGTRSDIPSNKGKVQEPISQKFYRKFLKLKMKFRFGSKNPRKTGEVHRWMHDRFSLRKLLEDVGFTDCNVCTFNSSSIPNWDSQNLDISLFGNLPRKPDSLFMEGRK